MPQPIHTKTRSKGDPRDEDEPGPSLDTLAQQNQLILYQNELTRLERNWEQTRRELCVMHRHGTPIPPSRPVATGFALAALGLFVIAALSHQGVFGHKNGPLWFALGLLLGLMCVFFAGTLGWNADRYRRALTQYTRKRRALEAKLAALD
ncbi:MAG: hypothetical protein MUF64_04290 [Polyangiaceae bacterium]|jgi:hypothetical protein|nr:hypothetical protein [Polyangiaceae bacterium]